MYSPVLTRLQKTQQQKVKYILEFNHLAEQRQSDYERISTFLGGSCCHFIRKHQKV